MFEWEDKRSERRFCVFRVREGEELFDDFVDPRKSKVFLGHKV